MLDTTLLAPIVVVFPELVTSPVKSALVVTVAAFPEIEPAIVELKVCVPVKVCAASVLAIVASAAGNVIVVPSVPAKVIELLAVNVFPSAMVKVALDAGAVSVTLLIELAVAAPNTGVVIVGLVKVLLVKVSVPAKVAKVPVVGSVTFESAVAVKVVAKAPEVVKFPPKVIVLPELSIPVPPLAPGKIPVTPEVKGSPVALVNTAAEGVPKFGVTKVGLVAKTKAPVPVSSVTALIKFALDGVAKAVATPVPNPLIPVAIGKPVALVNVPDVGVPNTGAVIIGLVKVLLVKVSVPSNVAKVPVVGKVTEVAAVVVNVVAKAPEVVKFPPKVIVFPELSTPVPPLAPGKIPVTPEVRGSPVALVNTAAEGVPKFGVTKVGEVALTTSPVPVVANSCTTPVLPVKLPSTLSAATF
jgi:predicted amidohydrolase